MASYPDQANPDLLARIPLSARYVLDVGCGTAALAREYRNRNPRAVLMGIENEPGAAAVAAERLDRLFLADLETDPTPFATELPRSGFDCIVYGDILEHLRDPWTVLSRQVEALADGGVVVVCMPNLEHWQFVERLLRGTWSYQDSGLMDRTHLRWFTPESTRLALLEAGLQPLDVTPRRFDRGEAAAFTSLLRPALENIGVDPEEYLARATPLQHVWRAQRQTSGSIAVVSSMLSPVGGVSDVRVIEPMRALASEPGMIAQVVNTGDVPEMPTGLPRIYVLHRPLMAGAEGLQAARTLLQHGWLTVCEFDDHPDYIPVLQRPDVWNFRAVHAIQTSTEPLAEVLRPQNPEVVVFPNGLAQLAEPQNHVVPTRQTLFFGGLNREQDWPPLLGALNAAAVRAGDRLHFRIVNDRGLFEALQTPFKEFYPLCDYATYQHLLARCEISFMPLADTPFNRCKSDLKFLEAAAHRVTALASHVVYGASIEDGRTGLLFRSPDELQQRLLRLVANPETARSMGEAARAHVAGSRMLAYQTARRAAWYRSLWARREELHRALLARVPELA